MVSFPSEVFFILAFTHAHGSVDLSEGGEGCQRTFMAV